MSKQPEIIYQNNPQQQQNQDYIPDYSNMQGNNYDQNNEEFIRIQIEVDDLLDDFEHRVLRGQYSQINDSSGKKEWISYSKDNKALINEQGIREILGRLIGMVNRAAKLTYKEDREIYLDMFYFDVSLSELIGKRSFNWEINIETAKALKDAAVELVWNIVTSSRTGFTAINLKSQYSKTDISRVDNTQNKPTKTFLGFPLRS
jgi:hypothetical protein